MKTHPHRYSSFFLEIQIEAAKISEIRIPNKQNKEKQKIHLHQNTLYNFQLNIDIQN